MEKKKLNNECEGSIGKGPGKGIGGAEELKGLEGNSEKSSEKRRPSV
jgi:hypothetical protein